MPDIRKRLKRRLVLALLLAVAGMCATVAGFVGINSPMNEDLAVAFIMTGFVLGPFWLIVTAIFRSKLGLFDLIVCDEGLLARWTYPLDLWQQWLAIERKKKSEEFQRGVMYIMLIFAGIGLLILIISLASELSFGIALLELLVTLCLPLPFVLGMYLARRLTYRRERKKPEIVLSRYGVLVGYAFYSFFKMSERGSIIKKVTIEDPFLEIECGWQSSGRGAGHQTRTTRIPIPDDALEEAAQIAEKLGVEYSYERVRRLRLELEQNKRR